LSENYPALKDIIELERISSVEVVALSDWAESEGLSSIDYIKIDTQGSELDILNGAGDLINSVRCIDIEVEFNPIYEGQNLFWEVDKFLREKGFTLWRLSNLVHYSQGAEAQQVTGNNSICFDLNVRQENPAYGGQLFWADACYVNNNVFSNITKKEIRRHDLDIKIFEALGMTDIVQQITRVF
jgi:hypothetical protein